MPETTRPLRDELVAELVVDLVAVAVALVDRRLAVDLARARPLAELDRLRAEPHRAAEVLDLLLLGQQVDHRVRRLGIHLGRVRALEAADVARELRDGDVHAEADAEVRDPLLARDPAGEDLALPAARAEAAGDEHAVGRLELLDRLLVGHVLGVEPAHVHLRALVHARVLERLVHGEVGVVQLHVLADERDLDVLAPLDDQVGEVLPLAEHGRRRVEAEPLADELVEPLALEALRDEVDVGHVGRADHGARVDVGEERDLLPDVVRERRRASGRRRCPGGYRCGAAR